MRALLQTLSPRAVMRNLVAENFTFYTMRLQKTTLYLFPLLLLGSSPLHGASWFSSFFAPDEATTLHNMGVEYYHQGKYEEALQYYLRALEIRENKLGVDHPDVAGTLNNIGVVYYNQGKYEEALQYYLRDLEISEKKLGVDHPDVATTLNNIGVVYYNQDKYEEALKYHLRALEIREKKLGSGHPSTITTRKNVEAIRQAESSTSDGFCLVM